MTHDTTPLHIVIVGHVDHGKSTLVGRLLHQTGSLPDGRIEAVRAASEARGVPFEWAFLLDAFQAERDQGITIDTTRITLDTEGRPTVVVDAPGHKEFLKNMITGAAGAEAAVLVVDAVEGVREQTRRHGYLLHLLGLTQVVVAVNKMDAVGYDPARFAEVEVQALDYLREIGLTPAHVVPVAARDGVNLAAPAPEMPWYDGPSLTGALAGFRATDRGADRPLRFPVQDVLKLDARRIVVGRIESGRLRIGDEIVFAPSGTRARVAGIEGWNNPAPAIAAVAGQSIGVTLDQQIFVERGHVATAPGTPPLQSRALRARVFWLGAQPLAVGARLEMRLATASHPVEVTAIERVIDADDLSAHGGERVERGQVAELTLTARGVMSFDAFADHPALGRFVLVDGLDVAGGGIVAGAGQADLDREIHPVAHLDPAEARWRNNGHRGGVFWLTGLSGAGKTTIAMEAERHLLRKGRQVFVLDGDNLRTGLNRDLGFGPNDRSENIRRAAEVAHLMAEAGMIVIASFISPYRADRAQARAIRADAFTEVHVKAALDLCKARDPKGLYARAIAGEIKAFTGISAPYEEPENPDLVIDTGTLCPEEAAAALIERIERTTALLLRQSARRPDPARR